MGKRIQSPRAGGLSSGSKGCPSAATSAKGPVAQPDKTTAARPSFDISSDAFAIFATRVQPILMNACASCHVSGKGGSFHLTRNLEATLLNRKAVQQNLAADFRCRRFILPAPMDGDGTSLEFSPVL